MRLARLRGVSRTVSAALWAPLVASTAPAAQRFWARWRDFAREILIVVLGVLIALGAQEIVNGWHDQSASAEARANIRAEIAENLGRMAQRDKTRACVDARLAEIAAFLARAEAGAVQPAMRWIGRPQTWPMQQNRWDAAASAGKASLLTPKEQGDYGAIYANTRDFQANEAVEQLAWAQLRGLADQARVTPQQAALYRQALQNARYAAWLINVNIWQASADAKKLRIKPHTDWVGSRGICIASDTPFEEAVRQTGASQLGEPR